MDSNLNPEWCLSRRIVASFSQRLPLQWRARSPYVKEAVMNALSIPTSQFITVLLRQEEFPKPCVSCMEMFQCRFTMQGILVPIDPRDASLEQTGWWAIYIAYGTCSDTQLVK